MRIDAHQHFWNYHPVKDAWINDDMKAIQRDFSPADLQPIIFQNNMDGTVAVQADQSETETDFLLNYALKNSFVKGVVGWVDLLSTQVEKRLAHYAKCPLIKGFRHVVQSEPEIDFLLRPDFKNGIGLLNKYGFTYDILIYPQHLPFAIELVKQFPHQPFVIDHLAKPLIKQSEIADWKKNINTISQYPNVYCKLSGMVTEADWQQWNYAQLFPYIDAVVKAFGVSRIMYGSDWPVCLVAASYRQQLAVYEQYFEQYSAVEKAGVFGENATRFYKL